MARTAILWPEQPFYGQNSHFMAGTSVLWLEQPFCGWNRHFMAVTSRFVANFSHFMAISSHFMDEKISSEKNAILKNSSDDFYLKKYI